MISIRSQYRTIFFLLAIISVSITSAQSSNKIILQNISWQQHGDVATTKLFTAESAELMDQSFKETTLGDVLNSYQGKIIYLDFWASWCGPCLAEMPYSKRLREKLKDSNIVMLYISLDEDFNRWVGMAKRIGLESSNSFVLLNVSGDPFFKKVNIDYIARYVIVDKEGEIVEANAQRPSQKGLDKKLEKLVQKK